MQNTLNSCRVTKLYNSCAFWIGNRQNKFPPGNANQSYRIANVCSRKMRNILNDLNSQTISCCTVCKTRTRKPQSRPQALSLEVKLKPAIALFTDNFTNLHYNTIQRGHEAISGYFVIFFARNCLAFVFNFIVMQM